MTNPANQRVGDYEVLGLLGAGGMGKVYKVRNVLSDRVEAMKVLLPNVGSQKDLVERFLREIKLLASLDHPNIAALRTAFTYNDNLVMIMEYVEGITLATRIEQGRIPAAEALAYTDQVLSALQYAHSRNIIHRDIKPANMMLSAGGMLKVMDFGIARSADDHALTTTGTTLGSLYYMSPEQIKGIEVDGRSDLYSVAVSLYEMVTAQRPFQATSEFSLMSAHLKEEPKPPVELFPDLPPHLNDLILTGMRKDPAERFQTAVAFRAAVNSVRSAMAPVQAAQSAAIAASAGATSTATSLLQDAQPSASTEHVRPPLPAENPSSAYQVSGMAKPPANHRVWYVALGGALVVALLFAAGLYLPRRARIHASDNSKTQPSASTSSNSDAPVQDSSSSSSPATTPVTPVPNSGATPDSPDAAAGSADVPVPAPATTTEGAPAHVTLRGKVNVAKREKLSTPAANPEHPEVSQQPAAPNAGNADPAAAGDLEHVLDQLSSRAAAVQSSLDNLQRQQRAQGLGMRGDIMASQERMNTYMAKAQDAIRSGDDTSAKKYMDAADSEINNLEKFLGH